MWRALQFVLITEYCLGDQIKQNEKGGMWCVWVRGKVCTCVPGFSGERMKEITWKTYV